MSENIGYATLSVIPSAVGFSAALSKSVAPQMATAGALGGASLLGALKKAMPVAAVLTAVGVLAKIGSTFHDMTSTIRVGTGATGKALDGLVASAKNVGKGTAASFEDVGKTVTALNVRLGLTGPTLELLSKQFLAAGRITKQSLDLNTVTGSFNAFGITGAKMSSALDDLFRVSQATGVGINALADAATRGAPAFRQFGLSFADSAALVGVLDKAGINSGKTIMALTIGLTKFSKAGKAPGPALRETVKSIEAFTKSGNDAKAIALAAGIFGTRGAAQFVAAVKSGKVNLDDMMKSSGASGDSIMAAADAVSGLSGKWSRFMNNVLVAVEPVATRVFDALNSGLKFVLDVGIPTLEKFGAALSGLVATFQSGGFSAVGDKIGASISAAWPGIQAQLAKWGTAFWAWIQPQIVPMLEKLGELLGALGTWLLNTGVPWLGEHLKTWGIAFWAWIQPMIPPFMAELGKLLLKLFIWMETVARPAIDKQLAAWAWSFIKWVPGASISLLLEMDKLAAQLIIWMVTKALPAIAVQLARWALAFYKWVPGAAISLILEMVKLGAKLTLWMTFTALPAIVAKLVGWAWAFVRWIPGAAVSMLVEFGKLLVRLGVWWATTAIPAIVGWVAGMPGRIASAASGLFDGLKDAFRSAINWIIRAWNGLSFKLPSIDTHIPGVGAIGGFSLDTPNVPQLAQGGIVPATPGGRLVRVAEGGYAEAVVPLNGRQSLGNSLGGPVDLSASTISRLAAATAAALERVQIGLDGRVVSTSVDYRIGMALR